MKRKRNILSKMYEVLFGPLILRTFDLKIRNIIIRVSVIIRMLYIKCYSENEYVLIRNI